MSPQSPHLDRRALLGGAAGVAALSSVTWSSFVAPPAMAVAAPRIYSCAEWGAAPATIDFETLNYRPSMIAIHHTAYPNTTDYSMAQAFARARQIQNDHFLRGIGDTGQQFTISRGGYVMEGCHGSLAALRGGTSFKFGAHAKGSNDKSIGIENDGLYTSTLPTEALWKALVTFVAYCCQQYQVPVSGIVGHRQLNSTQCPGDLFYSKLATLRSHVQIVLDGGPVSGPPDPGTPPSATWAVLQAGSVGFRVSALQHLLGHHGQSLTVDGSFGPATTAAVKAFQTGAGLGADGIVGTQTRSALVLTIRSGDTGPAVRAAQVGLNGRGQSLTVDGSFGPATLTAVKAFQGAAGLDADGVVGPITWRSLLSAS